MAARKTSEPGLAVLAAGLLLLVGCANPVPVGPAPDAGTPPEFDAVATVPFVTNRQLETREDGGRYYGGRRGELSAGVCTVGLRGEEGELLAAVPEERGRVLAGLERRPGEDVVLYVHGYNEDFARSCRHAAMMQARMGLAGRLLIFSWPADRKFVTYGRDAGDLAWSLPDLQAVLGDLSAVHGAENVTVMGHSLGARGTVTMLARLGDERPWDGSLGRLVLLAADIDREDFLDDVTALRRQVGEIVVYTSGHDRALWLSTIVNGSGRLGIADDDELGDGGLEVVDVTATGAWGLTGHLYHLRNPAVIEDLGRLLGTRQAEDDPQFRRAPAEVDGAWRLERASAEPESPRGRSRKL